MKTNENVNLDLRLVDIVKGLFYIPSYQRGYRWGKDEVRKMLADIYSNGAKPYCLQPIVVKHIGSEHCQTADGREVDLPRYELIDGQQRLTTLFLIYCYIRTTFKATIRINFMINYQTRPGSRDYLLNPTEADAGKYIDYHYIHEAYTTIGTFFQEFDNPTLAADKIYSYLCEQVRVIWYEVRKKERGDNESRATKSADHADRDNSIDLFTRLNIGKIPLNNAELVKALFLSRDGGLTKEKQLEIATSWDTIERELHVPELWAFLTNAPAASYAARIELLFNMIAEKQLEETNEFFTFEYFLSRIDSKGDGASGKDKRIGDEWARVQRDFLRLKGWFDDHTLYHKIGFLVTAGHELCGLMADSETMNKQAFRNSLDQKIVKALAVTRDKFQSLSYQTEADKPVMEKILLLFNVESVCILKNSTERYSFDAHKAETGWSLEHIHAQESEGLNNEKDWSEWLQEHRKSLKELSFGHLDAEKAKDFVTTREVLIKNIDSALRSITRVQFLNLFPQVVSLLSESGEIDYLHTMSNMALLSRNMNSAFRNSTFAVKRAKMLDKDRQGEYIPICTRRVFLKYYTETERQQLSFWGKVDRDAYIERLIGNDKNPELGLLTRYLTLPQEGMS